MVKSNGIRILAAALCVGVASCASAHPFYMSVSHHHSQDNYYSPQSIDNMLFQPQGSDENPKLWTEMTPKERAEIWPFLSPKMQRYYWRSMTDAERRAMRAEFSPSTNEKFRKRYASPMGTAPCAEPAHRAKYRMSPEERARMREQIREMHIEFHRFNRPPSVASEVQPENSSQR